MNPISTLEFLQVTFSSVVMLCLIGYGSIRFIEIIFKKKLLHFANQLFGLSSDFVVKINFFLFIGVSFLLLYAQVLLLLKVFNVLTLYSLSVLSGIVLLFDILKNKEKIPLNLFRVRPLLPIIGITISLGLIALLRSTIILGELASTAGDAAVHSVIISRIIRFNIFSQGFLYLPGSHVIAAFLTIILDIPIYKTVTLLTASFSVLVFLSFYCLGVSHTQKPMYGYLCAFLATLFWFSTYSPIYWGGLPVMIGIYVTVSFMAFSTNLVTTPVSEQLFHRILFTTLLLIPVLTIHPVSLFYVVFWLLLLMIKNLISHRKYRMCLKNGIFLLFPFVIAAFLSITLLMPVFVYALSVLSGSLPFPSQVMSQGWWDVQLISPILLGASGFTLIPYGVLACIVLISMRFVQKYKLGDSMRSINRFLAPFSQVSETMLVYYVFYVVIYLYIKYIWIFRAFLPSERIYQLLGIIFTMLQFLSIVVFWIFLSNLFLPKIKIRISYLKNPLNTSALRALSKYSGKARKFFALILLSLIFLLSVNVSEPFVMTSNARLGLNEFHVVTDDDIKLQFWMKQNLGDSSNILVSWGDAGQYVPIIAEKKVLLEYGNMPADPLSRERLQKYRSLLKLLETSPDNSVTLELLRYFNITHVYVGAKESTRFGDPATSKVNFPEYTVLNASLLNSAGHYKLTYRVGDAWLFEIVYNATVATVISACDATIDWFTFESDVNASATIAVDTTTYMEGQGSIKWAFKFNGK